MYIANPLAPRMVCSPAKLGDVGGRVGQLYIHGAYSILAWIWICVYILLEYTIQYIEVFFIYMKPTRW